MPDITAHKGTRGPSPSRTSGPCSSKAAISSGNSPFSRHKLDKSTAELVVDADDREEVIRTLKVAFAHGVPNHAARRRTGHYGQALPLSAAFVPIWLPWTRSMNPHRPRHLEPGIIIAQLRSRPKALPARTALPPLAAQTADRGGFILAASGGVWLRSPVAVFATRQHPAARVVHGGRAACPRPDRL